MENAPKFGTHWVLFKNTSDHPSVLPSSVLTIFSLLHFIFFFFFFFFFLQISGLNQESDIEPSDRAEKVKMMIFSAIRKYTKSVPHKIYLGY